jgi:hypothetical protein
MFGFKAAAAQQTDQKSCEFVELQINKCLHNNQENELLLLAAALPVSLPHTLSWKEEAICCSSTRIPSLVFNTKTGTNWVTN